MNDSPLYGIAAEYESPDKLVEAARAVRSHGYVKFEVFGPYPIKDLDEIVPSDDPVPFMVLGAGVTGGITAFVLQFYIAAIDYPTNIGGRPLNSWPAWVPIMFELSVLFAAFAAFFGTLWLCGLPLPHHPVFNLREICRASKDRFFLCVESEDPTFTPEHTTSLLQSLDPLMVWEIGKD